MCCRDRVLYEASMLIWSHLPSVHALDCCAFFQDSVEGSFFVLALVR